MPATTATIRVPAATHAQLLELARERGRSIGQVIEEFIAEDKEQRFFAGLADDFARLQDDPDEWADYQAELAAWDVALKDGLEDESWDE